MVRYKFMAVLLTFVCGCAPMTSSLSEEKSSRIEGAQSVIFLADVKDKVFGTKLSGLFMKPTEDFQTDWRSNDVLGDAFSKIVASPRREFQFVAMDSLKFRPEAIKFDTIDEAFSQISSELSASNPQSNADIHLILLHVPVDPVPHAVAGAAGRMFVQGMIGLAWELGTTYKQSYVVRVNSGLNALSWGRAQCIIVYALAAVDAHSHQVITKTYPRWAEHPLPDDFWISDYQSLTTESKVTLRNACLGALTQAAEEDLRKIGFY